MPYDLDIFMHMNNANYLKHCDTGRIKLYVENGVWDAVAKCKSSLVVGANNNRYRKALTLFTLYELRTKVLRLVLARYIITFLNFLHAT